MIVRVSHYKEPLQTTMLKQEEFNWEVSSGGLKQGFRAPGQGCGGDIEEEGDPEEEEGSKKGLERGIKKMAKIDFPANICRIEPLPRKERL